MRHRSARTTMQWVKGHDGNEGNEGSDALAKQWANRQHPDPLNLDIPKELDVQGAKLMTLMQATAYKGILEWKQHKARNTTTKNSQLTHLAIKRITGESETNATIWINTWKKIIRLIVQQFLFKSIHRTHLVRKYWGNINGCEDREICTTCNETETMSHILIHCKERNTQLIWTLVKTLWPHQNIPRPEIMLGTILGCGNITLQLEWMRINNQWRQWKMMHQGLTQLFQILLLELAYLIWVLRCERVIQEKLLTKGEIKARWYCAINDRLTIDKVTATKIIRTKRFTQLIEGTWEPALLRSKGLKMWRAQGYWWHSKAQGTGYP